MALERQYIIPLRKEWLKVPRYKRAKKGIRAIKEFMARHMKAEMDDVKLGRWLNEAVWARGIKNPPHKIKVKAVKDDKNIVMVELFELSERAKKIDEKEAKRTASITEKKKAEEAKRKAEEEKAKKEAEAKAEEEKKKEEAKTEEEKAREKEQKKIEEEKEKELKKMPVTHEHKHKPKANLPHDKHQVKHPVRQALEK